MQSYQDPHKKNRELTRFYDRIRLHLTDLYVDESAERERNLRAEKKETEDVPEDDLYGMVTEAEFQDIINTYNSQQISSDNKDTPVTCHRVVGGNYAKLLHSKHGFHHLGSTTFLTRDLNLQNVHMNSFLGGHNSYDLRQNETLDTLREAFKIAENNRDVQRAISLLDMSLGKSDKRQEAEAAFNELERTLKVDPKNGEALAGRGRFYAQIQRYPEAIRDLVASLKFPLKTRDNVMEQIAEAYYSHGLHFFQRDTRQAQQYFEKALEFKPRHDGAVLHANLCRNNLDNRARHFRPTPAYRK